MKSERRPVVRETSDNVTFEKTMAFSGSKTLLQEATRFNERILDTLAATAKEHGAWDRMVEKCRLYIEDQIGAAQGVDHV